MLIKVSRVLVVSETSIIFFSLTLPAIYLIPAPSPSSTLSIQALSLIAMSISLIFGVIFGMSSNVDIEVCEEESMIGGPIFYTKRVSFFQKFRHRQFVTRESLDVEASQKRNFFDRIFGVYKIYNKEGRGFKICKYYFFRKDFKKIQSKLDEVLGISIS